MYTGGILLKKRNRVVAWIFSFLFFVPGFNHNVHADGNINILIVGDQGVGKSTLLHRLVTQNFNKPISEEEVQNEGYEHGKICPCKNDYRIKIAEMDFGEEGIDYFYQNANIIIHMSHVSHIPTKQVVSDWYDEFVRIILKGQQEQNPELVQSIFDDLKALDDYEEISSIDGFRANPEDISYRHAWFSPLQLAGKIGYIIFVVNGSDSFNTFDECQELWRFIGTFPNARSILTFDSISSKGDGDTIHGVRKGLVTLNEWIHTKSTLSNFGAFDDKKKNLFYRKYHHNPRRHNLEHGETPGFTDTTSFCAETYTNSSPTRKHNNNHLKISKPTKCFFCSCIVSGILLLISFVTDLMCCESDSDEENLINK